MDFDTSSSCADTILAMRRQEEKGYVNCDYLADIDADMSCQESIPVDSNCRFVMAQWCYQIVDFCNFKRETTAIAMSYLDRFLATYDGRQVLLNRSEFQLAAMTALYTAVKIHENEAMQPQLISSLSQGAHSKEAVEAMECRMLKALEWRMNPPTSMSFVDQFLVLLMEIDAHGQLNEATSTTVRDLAQYQTELAVRDYDFVVQNASTIALSAILNAFESLCVDITNIELILSRAAAIDCQSTNLRRIRLNLYESIAGQPGSERLYQKLIENSSGVTPGSPCVSDKYVDQDMSSVHTSPRSVSTSN